MAAVVALALLPLALTAASDCEEGLCPVSHLQALPGLGFGFRV